jgi:hypothetical protein
VSTKRLFTAVILAERYGGQEIDLDRDLDLQRPRFRDRKDGEQPYNQRKIFFNMESVTIQAR